MVPCPGKHVVVEENDPRTLTCSTALDVLAAIQNQPHQYSAMVRPAAALAALPFFTAAPLATSTADPCCTHPLTGFHPTRLLGSMCCCQDLETSPVCERLP